jgi:UDP-3-O-[3-hydroxymyristoyl] glucosamine N-acyltransferase
MQIKPIAVSELAALIGAELKGDPAHKVTGFNEIHRVASGDCLFVDHPKYYGKALSSAATTIIINKEVDCPEGKALLIHPEPFSAFNKLTKHFSNRRNSDTQISVTAKIGSGTRVMPGVFIGDHSVIGDNCLIHPNVVIYDGCVIGNNVVIHAGTVIGSDAFYFKKRERSIEPLYSCGIVEIQDDVVIGAGCTIDRGVTAVTKIGRGTVIDNQVHIAHDVMIGELCQLAGQIAVAGACNIGNKVTLWGQVGISSSVTIGDGASILAQSGVGENVPAGETWFGTPAAPSRDKMKEIMALKQLPDLIKKLYR